MKEVIRGRAPDTMDTLVQQTKSLFTAEVLHFPLPAKFKMSCPESWSDLIGGSEPVSGTRDQILGLFT